MSWLYVADAMPSSFQCRWLLFLSSLLSDFCVRPTSFYMNTVSFRHRLNFAFSHLVSVVVLLFVVIPVHAIQSLSADESLPSFFGTYTLNKNIFSLVSRSSSLSSFDRVTPFSWHMCEFFGRNSANDCVFYLLRNSCLSKLL